jgi:hypothetical protein
MEKIEKNFNFPHKNLFGAAREIFKRDFSYYLIVTIIIFLILLKVLCNLSYLKTRIYSADKNCS